MELQPKAALIICGCFIVGLCYLVDQVALPVAEVTPPLLVRRADAGNTPTALVNERVGPASRPPRMPTGTTPKFARSSPFDLHVEANRQAADAVVLAALPTRAAPARPVQLPPVVEREPVELVVATAELQPEWPRPLMVVQAASTPDERGEAQPAERLAADQQATPAVKRYKVRKGDSLTKIARREWNSDAKHLVQLLIEANPQLRKRPDLVFVGQELIIPDPTASPALARPPATVARPHQVGETEPTLAAADNTPKSSETRKLRWYTIRKRDSLAAIARRFLQDAERWREIAELNQLREPNRILPGMRIRLPVMVVAAQG